MTSRGLLIALLAFDLAHRTTGSDHVMWLVLCAVQLFVCACEMGYAIGKRR